jgi:hypothetical protein
MHGPTTSRYRVRVEPAPYPRPTGWRAMFEVVDHGTSLKGGVVVKRCWAWGEADRWARYLNAPTAAEWQGRVPTWAATQQAEAVTA